MPIKNISVNKSIKDDKILERTSVIELKLILGADCDLSETDITNIDLFSHEDNVFIYNHYKGYLIKYEPDKDIQTIINRETDLLDLTGLGFYNNQFFFIHKNHLLIYDKNANFLDEILLDITPDSFTVDPISGEFYFYIRNEFRIHIASLTKNQINIQNSFQIEGIGFKSLCVHENNLWHTDYTNHMIYCTDKTNGKTIMAIPSPYLRPIGICIHQNKTLVSFEGRTFIHHKKRAKVESVVGERYRKPFISELKYQINNSDNKKYITSNKFMVEFNYTLESKVQYKEDNYDDLFVRIALPYTNDRQKLVSTLPIGLDFKLIEDSGILMAEFHIGKIDYKTNIIFGYKTLVQMTGIKYMLENSNITKKMIDYNNPELNKYLEYDDDLDMEQQIVKEFAHIGEVENIIETVYAVRHKIYKHLKYDYELVTSSSPAAVIECGSTGCGGYSKLILACLRLNGIPARDSGKYSVQPETFAQNENETIIFNHSWMEFYLPTIGWIPIESSRDSFVFNGRNKENGWLGLDWTHLECLTNSNRNFEYAFDGKPENRVPLSGFLDNNPSYRIIGEVIDG